MSTSPSQDPRLAQAIGELYVPEHRAGFFEDLDEVLAEIHRQELIEATRPRPRRRLALAMAVLTIVAVITGFVWLGADPPAVDRDVVGSVPVSTEPPSSNAGGSSTTVLPSTPALATLLTDYEWTVNPAGTATFAAHEGHKVELRGLAVRDDVMVVAATVLTATDRCRWAALWTSSDGLDWDRVPHDDAVFGVRSPDDTEGCSSTTQDVVATDSGFLAIGDRDGTPVAWQSDDGRVWTVRELGPDHNTFLMSAASEGGTTVIAGLASGAPVVLSSQDGTTWMQQNVPPIPGHDNPSLTVAPGPAGFLMVGEYQSGTEFLAASWLSSDGTTWEQAGDLPLRGNSQPAVGPIVADETGYRVFGWADGQSVAITSPNGVDWAVHPTSAELANAHGAGVSRVGIVVVGRDSSAYTDADPVVTPMALVSLTGDDWTRLDPEPVAKQSGLLFVEPFGDHFIAVGTARDRPGAPKQAVAIWVAAPPGTF